MSVHVMSLVWKRANISENTLLTLLALADWADDDGYCWPKIPQIATKIRITERAVYDILNRLSEADYIEVERSPGIGNKYQINLSKLDSLPNLYHERSKAKPLKQVQGYTPEAGFTPPLKLPTVTPEVDDIAIRKNHQLTINEPPFSLSGESQRESPKKGSRLPPAFVVTERHREWARSQSLPSPDSEIDRFRDHWTSLPGRRGTMLDWDATFRNWLRRAGERSNGNGNRKNLPSLIESIRRSTESPL